MTRGSADGNGLVTARRIVAGRYRLEERIGSGAMGVVWRGTDERLGRVVAVKQVFLHSGLDQREADEVRQRTLREGRIAARLQHAHAISVFDASIEGDEPWLVMEYLPSRSLAAVLSEHGTIDPRQAARMGRQVADALDAAHQAGIVHRDVKPGNVLIGADGVVKITDFGISRATGDLTLTRTGVLAGTPAYLAPEVARGEDSTPASDVFSLGATLYAAVEGIPPFGADDNALALLHSVAAGQVTPPNRAGPLTALLMRLLRDDPDERPSAAEARAQLGRVAVGARDDHGLAGLVAATSDPESGATDLPAARASSSMGPGPAGSAPDRSSEPRNVSPGTPSAGSARPRAAGPPTRPGLPPAQSPTPARGGVGWGPSARPASRAARRVPRPTMAVVIVVLLLAVAAGGVVGVALLSSRTDAGGTSAGSPGPQPGTTSVPDADPGGAMVGAVRDYYAVVTGDSAAGWARLGPELQSQAGGLSTYQGFWSTITRVQVLDASADGRDSVLARLEFEPSGRPPTRETHRLGLLHGSDGHWLINSDERLAG